MCDAKSFITRNSYGTRRRSAWSAAMQDEGAACSTPRRSLSFNNSGRQGCHNLNKPFCILVKYGEISTSTEYSCDCCKCSLHDTCIKPHMAQAYTVVAKRQCLVPRRWQFVHREKCTFHMKSVRWMLSTFWTVPSSQENCRDPRLSGRSREYCLPLASNSCLSTLAPPRWTILRAPQLKN